MIVAGVVPCADGDVAPRWALTRRGLRRASAVAAFWATLAGSAAAQWAPDHPDVAPLLAKALSYLETAPDDRLGARCLVGLAFLKSGAPADHPLVMRAVEACREQLEAERSYSSYLYGKALAIILLTERNQSSDRELVRQYAELLRIHQKPHGGFGYTSEETGDTSQTQYAALAYWQMLHHGIAPNADSAQSCLTWLMRTQDVSGGGGCPGVATRSLPPGKQEPGPSAPVSMGTAG
ncbi:MAG TPA: hypothetical protein PKC18_18520, partial [Lacipirellulaceae bacterium]|nr:hypothetical protein [Lacipirellulaceae bacterium]